MKLCLSVRIGEKFFAKREAALSLAELADIAVASGYHALCMRASQLGIHTPRAELIGHASMLRERGLRVSMVTGDFPIPENTDDRSAGAAPDRSLSRSRGGPRRGYRPRRVA